MSESGLICVNYDLIAKCNIELTNKQLAKCRQIESIMLKLPRSNMNGWPVGFEHVIIRHMIETPMYSCYANLIRAYLDRPQSELAALPIWNDNTESLISEYQIITLAKLSSNNTITNFRKTSVYTSEAQDSLRIHYPDPQLISPNILKICNMMSSNCSNSIAHAIIIFLKFVALHPFVDANGRVGRLLFQLTLARHGLITYPLVPIGPLMRSRYHQLIHPFRTFISCGGLECIFDVMLEIVVDTSMMACKVLKLLDLQGMRS